MKLFNLEFSI